MTPPDDTHPDLTVVHSSDLHIDSTRVTETFHPLCRVLDTARSVNADVILLAGDIFDHNRLPLPLLNRTARLLSDVRVPVIILPGNHDCLTADSVYRRGGIGDPENVHVLGVHSEEATVIEAFDVEIWGKAHYDHKNMSPLAEPRPRTTHRQIAMAHGHWARTEADRHRAWLIHDEEILATGADYVALGHWPQATPAGDGQVQAFYSGSPDLAATVNVVRFKDGGAPEVTRAPLVDHPSR
jgi:DNA repair exonuclease SbcCD nuclease subunit